MITSKDYLFEFGKYNGFTVGEVMEMDPGYLLYFHDKSDWFELGFEIYDELTTEEDPLRFLDGL